MPKIRRGDAESKKGYCHKHGSQDGDFQRGVDVSGVEKVIHLRLRIVVVE